ncbi:hypothetical protein L1987_27389 [Smallanthus sonchifolius]|uniref:Uncharacterized protein n=1 Tax=Smallanthus sonchifolius TaxID=185202 RepID=A0ACB9IB34_9ASTR|nr:hypothetical protein L1987_27389 [Smallanthus sonchifolius]
MYNESNPNSSFSLKSILEKDKLDNSNFMDWYRNLKIVIRAENKMYVLEEPIPEEPTAAMGLAHRTWDKHVDDSIKEMFQQQARHERFEVMRSLISCRMQEGSSVSTHVLKMKGYIDHLARFDSPLSNELAGDIFLNSLPKSYDQFTLNYNMNAWDKTVPELHMILKTAEMNIPNSAKSGPMLMIKDGRVRKFEAKEKGKKTYKSKGKGKAVAKNL